MGFGTAIKEAFSPVIRELGGLESVPDIDRRGQEEVKAEKHIRASEAEATTIPEPATTTQDFDDELFGDDPSIWDDPLIDPWDDPDNYDLDNTDSPDGSDDSDGAIDADFTVVDGTSGVDLDALGEEIEDLVSRYGGGNDASSDTLADGNDSDDDDDIIITDPVVAPVDAQSHGAVRSSVIPVNTPPYDDYNGPIAFIDPDESPFASPSEPSVSEEPPNEPPATQEPPSEPPAPEESEPPATQEPPSEPSTAWAAGVARAIQLEELTMPPASKPQPEELDPEPPKKPEPAPEEPTAEPPGSAEPLKKPQPPAPESKKPDPEPAPTEEPLELKKPTEEPPAPEKPSEEPPEELPEAPIHIEGEAEELFRGPESSLGYTGLGRVAKMSLSEDYAIFADVRFIGQALLDVMTGALWAMESEDRDEFRRYVDSVKRSRLKICYRDALHKSPTIYATEELAMAAVTKDFSDFQHDYLKKALKLGSVTKDDLVSKVYLDTCDDGSRAEISEEDYRAKINSLIESCAKNTSLAEESRAKNVSLIDNLDETLEAPPLFEPDEVYDLVQSVEDLDQDRGVDDLVVRMMQQLAYYDAGARELAETTLAEIDDMHKPITRTVYKVNGQEFDSYSAALAALRTSGDAAFTELIGEDYLAKSITCIRFEYSQIDGERTFISSGPVPMDVRENARAND